MSKVIQLFTLVLVLGQLSVSYLLWENQSNSAQESSSASADIMPSLINEQKPHKISLEVEDDAAIFASEQRNINRIILNTLTQISTKIAQLDVSEENHTRNDADATPAGYQADKHYDLSTVENARYDSQILIDEVIASQQWTLEDNHALLEITPYLDQQQRDNIRQQLVSAINAQKLSLETPLILPF